MGETFRRDESTGTWHRQEPVPRSSWFPTPYARLILATVLTAAVAGFFTKHTSTRNAGSVRSIVADKTEILPRRELFYRLERARSAGRDDAELSRVLADSPPEVLWTASTREGRTSYRPIAPRRGMVVRTLKTDLAVFGAELEAVTTAMAAADRGVRVALIVDTPLGGLCSDAGGNLRYIDGVPSVPRTSAQLELYRAMGVRGQVAIPDGTDARIRALLADRYAGRIEVTRVKSLTNLRVTVDGKVQSVLTDSGVRFIAGRYLDMDPECRFGELCGLPLDPRTPSLAYGLVFDLHGLRDRDYAALRGHQRLWPEAIIGRLGVTRSGLERVPGGKESFARLSEALRHDSFEVYENSSLGYRALADGFDLYMRCKEAARSDDDLRWLNERRTMSGFNVAHLGEEANFNSVSYMLDEAVLQHAHSLHREVRWHPIVATEATGLRDYFRFVLDNPHLTVRLPDELYVRRSTAAFATSEPYTDADFEARPKTRLWMAYPMDFRELQPRPGFDDELMAEISAMADGSERRWDCRPTSCGTSIPNLFLLNKCAMTPRFSGGLRIVQNLITTGQAWVDATYPGRIG